MRPVLLPILPTRVRRNYRGGLQLDRLQGLSSPADGEQPENWLASTTEAKNPDFSPIPGEGLTRVATRHGERKLRDLIGEDPVFYLGEAHVKKLGSHLGFLAKLLDSSMRLHVQVHPTAAFAREHLGSPYGKLEVYYVLAVRPGCEGYIRLGFQNSPGRDRWREIIATQDIAAMDHCFDRIPVHPGEVWVVPGGMPHAIGEGVLMIEVMEPSDLVVRCEFEREGVVLPPNSRYMGRDLDFCLQVFDYTALSVEEVRMKCEVTPQLVRETEAATLHQLVGATHTSCFEIFRLQARSAVSLPPTERGQLLIQTRGAGQVEAGGDLHAMAEGNACFIAAAGGAEVRYRPSASESEILLCRPV